MNNSNMWLYASGRFGGLLKIKLVPPYKGYIGIKGNTNQKIFASLP